MVEADSTAVETTSTENDGPTYLEKRIIRQVEYYFGDINLGRDKFLQEQIKLEDGWIPMETMLKFNRLSQLSKDPLVISKALQKSSTKLMEVSEDNSKIRRSPDKPLPEMNEARRKELMSRTIYCKGFPKEGVTIHDMLEFFPQFGSVDNVIMRSYNDKATKTWLFKGSVFVIFSTVEDAKKFVELDVVKFKDIELIKKLQSDYLEFKRKEKLEAKANKQKGKAADKGDKEENSENKPSREEEEFPRGSVVQLKGLEGSEVNRVDIKAAIEKFGIGVAFVDFINGDNEASVRLDSKGAALELASRLKEGILEIKEDLKAEIRVLEGEEEEIFLTKAKEDKKKLSLRSRNNRFRGRGGFGRGKKRRGSPSGGSRRKNQRSD